jgi:hypothetical protein
MPGELTRFGEALAQGARDYANIKLADTADATARQRQLDDRAYTEKEEERRFVRGNTEDDRRRTRDATANRLERQLIADEQLKQSFTQALINEKLITPEELKDPAKVQAAWEKAQISGLVAKYQSLIEAGLLKIEEVGDIAKVNAAANTLGEQASTSRGNAQAEIDRLRDEGMAVSKQIEGLESRLAEPAQAPTQAQVLQRAVALAQQSKPGSTPSDADIQSFAPQAQEELREAAIQNKLLETQAARQQQTLLYNRLRDTQQRQQNLETRFKIAPGVATAAPVTTAPAQSAPRPATANSATAFVEALRARSAAKNPPAAAGAGAPALANQLNLPEVAAYNESQRQAAIQQEVRPLEEARAAAQTRIQVAQEGINRLRMNTSEAPSGNLFGQPLRPIPGVTLPANVVQQNRAQEFQRLSDQLQAGQTELSQAESRLRDIQKSAQTNTPVVAPKTDPFSDPSMFAPNDQLFPVRSRLTLNAIGQ